MVESLGSSEVAEACQGGIRDHRENPGEDFCWPRYIIFPPDGEFFLEQNSLAVAGYIFRLHLIIGDTHILHDSPAWFFFLWVRPASPRVRSLHYEFVSALLPTRKQVHYPPCVRNLFVFFHKGPHLLSKAFFSPCYTLK